MSPARQQKAEQKTQIAKISYGVNIHRLVGEKIHADFISRQGEK